MVKNKKADMGVETIFYIFMAVIFVVIVGYGVNKLFFVSEQISEVELVKIEKDLKDAITYCDDPLNSGNQRSFNFDHKAFNGVCIFGDDFSSWVKSLEGNWPKEDFESIEDGGDNIVLLQTFYVKDGSGEYVLNEGRVISSFSLMGVSDKSFCKVNKDNTEELLFEIRCE